MYWQQYNYPIIQSSLRDVSNMKCVFTEAKSGHPMQGCTLAELFIVFNQEMQGFGALGMLSDYFL